MVLLQVQRIMLAFVALSLAGCGSKNVNWDYIPGKTVNNLHTYMWINHENANANNGYQYDSLMEQRIHSDFNGIMEARGYRMVTDKEEADFLVNYTVTYQSKIRGQQIGTSFGYGYYGYGLGFSNDYQISQYEERALTIDFIDPKTNDVFWAGQARSRVKHDLTPEERATRINNEITDILSGFPRPPAKQ